VVETDMQMGFSNNHDRHNSVTLAQQSHATVQIGSLLYSWRRRLSSDYLSVMSRLSMKQVELNTVHVHNLINKTSLTVNLGIFDRAIPMLNYVQ
jgi:hypothetical protein